MRTSMRSVLAFVGLTLLALPASASAYELNYEAPSASIARGAPLTFAVRTDAPEGSVIVRVSGNDDVDASGLLTGPEGTWLDEPATQALPDLQVERAERVDPAAAAGTLLLAGVRDRRGCGHRGRGRVRRGGRRHDRHRRDERRHRHDRRRDEPRAARPVAARLAAPSAPTARPARSARSSS